MLLGHFCTCMHFLVKIFEQKRKRDFDNRNWENPKEWPNEEHAEWHNQNNDPAFRNIKFGPKRESRDNTNNQRRCSRRHTDHLGIEINGDYSGHD